MRRYSRQAKRGCLNVTALDTARFRELVRVCAERGGSLPPANELATLFATSRHNAYEVLYRLEALGLIAHVPATIRALVDPVTLAPAAPEVA